MTEAKSKDLEQPVQRPRPPAKTWYYRGQAFNLNNPDLMCHDLVLIKARRKWHVPFIMFWECIRRPQRRSVIVMPE